MRLIDTVAGEDSTPTIDQIGSRGIWAFIASNAGTVPEYLNSDVDSVNLAYYAHSGQKYISPLITSIIGSNDFLTDDNLNSLAKVVVKMCLPNWNRLYTALTVDYSPIENVDAYITESTSTTGKRTGTNSLTDSGTDNLSHAGSTTEIDSGTDTHALSGQDKTEHTGTGSATNSGDDITTNTGTVTDTNATENGTSETVNQLYGYNSSDAANDSSSTTTVNQTVTDTREDNTTSTLTHGLKTDTSDESTDTTDYGRTDTETLDLTHATQYNNSDNRTVNLSHSGSDSEDTSGSSEHTVHRHGNIGVTTNQQMINEEIELRKNFFYNEIFSDVDRLLCLSIY